MSATSKPTDAALDEAARAIVEIATARPGLVESPAQPATPTEAVAS